MKIPQQLTLEDINKYFYLVDDQHLYWKPQERSSFSNPVVHKVWNTKYANKLAGHREPNGSTYVRVNKKSYAVKHIVYALYHQKLATETLSHIDGNLSNNHIDNLVPDCGVKSNPEINFENGNKTLPVDYLDACFTLRDGVLTWRDRPAKHFVNRRYRKAWNNTHAGKTAGSVSNGRFIVELNSKVFLLHRIVWAMHYKEWPKGVVDHVDGDGFNNRIENLRDVDTSTNAKNMKRHIKNTSGVSGVYFDRQANVWYVQICKNYKKLHFGRFTTKEEAIEARHKAYKQLGFTERHGI
jgi:hypothetical protein